MNVPDLRVVRQSPILRRVLCTVIFLVAGFVSFAHSSPVEIPPGAYTNDKIRLVERSADEGDLPILMHAIFAVRDSDGLSRQENTGNQFNIRWKLEILKSGSVVRTLEKDEPIVPPFNWDQLPRQSGNGTEPFVRVASSIEWNGKNEIGQAVPGAVFDYRFTALFIRVLPQNGQTTIIGALSQVSGSFEVDGEPPVITITRSPNDEYTRDNVHVTVAFSDNNEVAEKVVKLDQVEVAESFTITTEGKHLIEVLARDAAGNTTTAEATVTIDRTPPTVVDPALPALTNSDVIVNPPAMEDPNPGEAHQTLNGQPFDAGGVVRDEGQYALVVTAEDLAFNSSTRTFTFEIEKTPPVIIVSNISQGQFYPSGVIPAVQVQDAHPGTVTATLNGFAYQIGTPVTGDGEYDLVVTATDLAGNVSVQSRGFFIDSVAPVITITGVEPGQYYRQPPTITVVIQEANPQTSSIYLDNVLIQSETVVTDEGRHELVVTAVDRAGQRSQQTVKFIVDTIPPVIAIQTPAEGALLSFDTIQVSGTIEEKFLKDVTVNGTKAIASSDLFVANNVHLNEGDNTITVIATDLAGGSTQATVAVRLDQTPPDIAILTPAYGSLFTQALVTVSGTVIGADVRDVRVNGALALVTGGQFVATNLRLSEGANTIRAIATDHAGNSQEASVIVTLDTVEPRVAITSPAEGSVTTASSTVVSGFVFDMSAPVVTVNGAQAQVNGDGSFNTTVSLSEGSNLISVTARDTAGNETSASITVTRDSQAPQVVSIAPADGSVGVPPNQLITITFSEDVKKSTVTSNTVKLMQSANLVTGTLIVSGRTVTLRTTQQLAGSATFTLTVDAAITDLVGNTLQSPASATFSTLDSVPPAPPTIDPPLPAVTSQITIAVAGTAESNARLEISGGAKKVTVLASSTGHYSAQVPLFENAINQLSVTATDLAGNVSAASTATIIQDSVRMVVLDADYEANGSILIDFSKPVDIASISSQNMYAVASSTISGSVIATSDPARIAFYPQTPLGTSPFVLKVEATVQDQGGRPLEYPFSKLFNSAAGDSIVQGEVWDNAMGQPLAGATVTQITPAVSPAPVTTADLRGQFVLTTSSGSVILRIERPGYLPVDRSIDAPAGQAILMFDARLEPEDSKSLTVASASASLVNSDASVTMDVPANTFAQATPLRLSKRDGQSLPAILPDGWSPVGVATIGTGALPGNVVTLRVSNDFGLGPFSSMPTAYYDTGTTQWKMGPSGFVTADGKFLELQTGRNGTYVFLVADPSNPPAPTLPDQPLQAAPPALPTPLGTPNLVPTPTGIYPHQRASVDVTFGGTQFRSGARFQAVTNEKFELFAGLGSVQTAPRTADLVAYSMGQISGGRVQFFASPSKAVDFSKLDIGFIDLEIHTFPETPQQPGVIDGNGGIVTSPDGNLKLEIPAGAVSRSVPVTVTALSIGSVTVVLPDYTLLAAMDISLGGTTFTLGGTLTASSIGPTNLSQFILARLSLAGSRSLWVLEGTCTYDGGQARCFGGLGSLQGVVRTGVYGIFGANVPIGFLTGSIANPQGGVAGAAILVTADATQLGAVSNTLGAYTIAVPVGSGNVKAANLVTGDEGQSQYAVGSANQLVALPLQIVTTPPRIVSITPAQGTTGVSANTAIRVTFSEAVVAATLNSATFKLLSSGSAVPGSILLTSNNTIGILTPSTALVSDTEYTVVVSSGVTDLTGNALANPVSSHAFRIADTTAPAASPDAAFKLFLPEGPNAPYEGVVRFEVPEADIEPGTAVIFVNETQSDITQDNATSAILAPCAAESSRPANCFTATLAGRITDTYFVELADAAEPPNQTRVDLPRMEYPDGTGAVFGPTGGEYTTSEGILIEITDGTFDTATPLQVKLATPAPEDVPAQPRDFATLGFFTLDTHGAAAKKEINLGFPIPQGITADDQVFVVKPVEYFGKKRWMPIEELFIEDGLLKTQTPPWPTVRPLADPTSAFSYVVANGAAPLYYFVGAVTSAPVVVEFDITDLVAYIANCSIERQSCNEFVMVLPVNQNYRMTISDINTGAIIFEGMPAPPLTEKQGTTHLQKPLSKDQTPPYVIGGTPLTITSWRVGAASGNIRSKIRFETGDTNADGVADTAGSMSVIGEPGALPEHSYAAIHNNRIGETKGATAAADGSFTVSVPYQFGDAVTLILSSVDVEPGASLRFHFSEPINNVSFSSLFSFHETDDITKKVNFATSLLNAQQILEIRPTTNLKSDTEYTLKLRGVQDLALNTMVNEMQVRFRTKAYNITGSASSGKVNDTLLIRDHLIVGKDDGIEIYSTANPFDLELKSTLSIPGGVRSLARYGAYVMAVGGGVQPQGGMLRQIDVSNFNAPRVIATLILTRYVGDQTDEQLGQTNPVPEGRPIKVLVFGQYAYIATIGVGVQVADLENLGSPVYTAVHRRYNEPNLKDIALYVKKEGENLVLKDIVLSGSSMHDERNNKLVSFKAANTANVHQLASNCGTGCIDSATASSVIPGTANNVEVLLHYDIDIDQDGRQGPEEDADANQETPVDKIRSQRDSGHTDVRSYEVHDIAFIASGIYGIHVLEITKIDDPKYLGTIKVGEGVSVSDLKLDSKNLRLYVPVGADGIYIVDIKDPFLINPNVPPQVIGKIQIANTITDGNVTIDEELNTVYVATKDQGLKSVLVGPLQMQIVTDKDNDGVYEHVGVIRSEGTALNVDFTLPEGVELPVPIPLPSGGYLPAGTPVPPQTFFPNGATIPPGVPLDLLQQLTPTRYYVLAQLPSSAGGDSGEVTVKVSATNFFDHPISLGTGNHISTFDAALKYRAPLDTNKDSHRLYVSDPFYITGHPELPAQDKVETDAKVISAGDFIRLELDKKIQANLGFVTTDLLRQSRFASRALTLDLSEPDKPEPRQNPALGTGETAYPPYLHSGEWAYADADFAIRGRGMDYAFTRVYQSQGHYDGPLGRNWDHVYFMRLREMPNGDVFFYDGMGRKELFLSAPPPNTPVVGTVFYLSPPGQFAELKKLEDGNWLIHQPDGTAFYFNNYGQLTRVQDRNENYMEFLYNPAGQLALVIDTMGRPIYYEYNEDGKLAKVRDFTGREWTFRYDEGVASPDPGRKMNLLTSVTTTPVTGTSNGNDFSAGKTEKYRYEGGTDIRRLANLTEIENGRGEVFITNTYDSLDRLERQIYGLDPVQFTYAENQATVRDRRRNDTVYQFNRSGNTTSITEAGFTTAMEYDPDLIGELPVLPSDGLLTKITYPEGNSTEYEYNNSIVNRGPGRRNQPNLLKVRQNPDQDRGTGGSDPVLTTTYEYETVHNQVTKMTDPRGNVTTYIRDQHANAKTVNMPEGITQNYEYNSYGQPTKETFGEGNFNTYEYYPEANGGNSVRSNPDQDTGGYLKKKTVGGLLTNSFVYDSLGRMTEFVDGNNVRSTYEINQLDQIVKETRFEPLSYQTIYHYDANNNMVKKLSQHSSAGGDGFTEYRYEYSHPLNYLTAESSELSPDVFATTGYQYDANGNRVLVTAPEGNQTSYEFDARDLNTATVRGFGSADSSRSESVYDGNQNQIRSIDGELNATDYKFDGYNRTVRVTDALGNFTESTYDNNGNLITETRKSASGTILAATTSAYDAANRLKTRSEKFQPADAVTTYNYDKNGRITSVVDARNNTTTHTYDTANRIAATTDAAGNTTAYQYDANGNTTSVTEREVGALGTETFVTTNRYDAANRVVETTDPAGDTMQYVYDSQSNQVFTVDAEGNQAATKYDNANRRIRTEEANGEIVTLYAYDQNSRLQSITDDNGNTTGYGYDALNRSVRTIYPDGKEAVLGYDDADNVTTATDPNGTVTTNSYDALNRLSSRNIAKAAGVEGTTSESYEYDGLSRLKRATDDDSVVELQYDLLSNVTTETQNGKTISNTYDAVGNRTEISYPSGRELTLGYDSLNRLNQIEEAGSPIVQYSYQGSGRTAGTTLKNGTHTEFQYDSDRRVTAIRHVDPANQLIAGYSYGWNKMDQRKYEQKLHENDRADVYSYDAIYRLTQVAANAAGPSDAATAQKTTNYQQDGVHNYSQITETESGISRSKTTEVNNRNQYTIFDGQPLSYDPNGNTKSLFGKQLSYDYANRLTKVVTPDGTTTTMSYDALGRRTAVSVNGQATNYVWSGQQALEEYGSAGTLQSSYVYSRGIDEVVQMRRGGQEYFYHMNSIGSVKAITDPTGNVVERYDYDPYGGRIIRADNTPPVVEQVRLKSGNLHIRLTESVRQQTFAATIRDASAQDVSFAVTFEEADRKVVLQPGAALLFGGQYTLTIQSGLSDLNGNRTTTNFERSFIVSGDEIYFDSKAPEVESIAISGGKEMVIRFTEEIAEFPTGAITLELNSQAVSGTLSFVPSSSEATYTLTEAAAPGAYTLALSSALKDEANKSLAAFDQVLLIAVPDQLLYQLERDVVSDSTIGNTIGFQGRNYDTSTGLQYFRARYLDSTTGRFISQDPLAFQDSPNHYSAFLNNGANYSDPMGLTITLRGDSADRKRALVDIQSLLVNEAVPYIDVDANHTLFLKGITIKEFMTRFPGTTERKIAELIETNKQVFIQIADERKDKAFYKRVEKKGDAGTFVELIQGIESRVVGYNPKAFPQTVYFQMRSVQTTLAHELLGHAYVWAIGTHEDMGYITAAGKAAGVLGTENEGMWGENQYRLERRLPLRTFYYYTFYDMGGGPDYVPPKQLQKQINDWEKKRLESVRREEEERKARRWRWLRDLWEGLLGD